MMTSAWARVVGLNSVRVLQAAGPGGEGGRVAGGARLSDLQSLMKACEQRKSRILVSDSSSRSAAQAPRIHIRMLWDDCSWQKRACKFSLE